MRSFLRILSIFLLFTTVLTGQVVPFGMGNIPGNSIYSFPIGRAYSYPFTDTFLYVTDGQVSGLISAIYFRPVMYPTNRDPLIDVTLSVGISYDSSDTPQGISLNPHNPNTYSLVVDHTTYRLGGLNTYTVPATMQWPGSFAYGIAFNRPILIPETAHNVVVSITYEQEPTVVVPGGGSNILKVDSWYETTSPFLNTQSRAIQFPSTALPGTHIQGLFCYIEDNQYTNAVSINIMSRYGSEIETDFELIGAYSESSVPVYDRLTGEFLRYFNVLVNPIYVIPMDLNNSNGIKPRVIISIPWQVEMYGLPFYSQRIAVSNIYNSIVDIGKVTVINLPRIVRPADANSVLNGNLTMYYASAPVIYFYRN